MGKHKVEMSAREQADAIRIARELAHEFAKIGPEADARNDFPMELKPLFKQSGLVGLNISKEYGGMGGDIWTNTQISRELAKGDPACALAFNMHFTMTGIFAGLLSEEARSYWLPHIAGEEKIVCGPFSEERAGLTGLADTVAVPTADGGWSCSGRKFWGTLCEAADIVAFNATVTDDDGLLPDDFSEHASKECVFILRMDNPGIRIEKTWDALGMRATGTHSVIFEDAEAGAGTLAGNFRGGLFGEFEWAAMTFSGVYLGLIEKAYDETVAVLRKKTLGATQEGSDVALKGLGYVQSGLGKMLVDKEACARTIEATCKMLLEGRDAEWDPVQRVPLLDVAKVEVTERASEIVSAGMRLIGGSAFRRGHTLERLYRDARSGPFHPLTTDQVYDFLGRSELGLMEVPSDAPAEAAVAG